MSKGGHGAAAASVLMLKKSEDKRQESALREAFKVSYALCSLIFIWKHICYTCVLVSRGPFYFLNKKENWEDIIFNWNWNSFDSTVFS